MSSLRRKYYFEDSILFTSDVLPLSSLPQHIDTIKFKILSSKQILALIKTDSAMQNIPNFLYIGAFEKSDTGYYISVQSVSGLRFGGGGSVGVYIAKEKDSFAVRSKMSMSGN